jgi:hypothetical protein
MKRFFDAAGGAVMASQFLKKPFLIGDCRRVIGKLLVRR